MVWTLRILDRFCPFMVALAHALQHAVTLACGTPRRDRRRHCAVPHATHCFAAHGCPISFYLRFSTVRSHTVLVLTLTTHGPLFAHTLLVAHSKPLNCHLPTRVPTIYGEAGVQRVHFPLLLHCTHLHALFGVVLCDHFVRYARAGFWWGGVGR